MRDYSVDNALTGLRSDLRNLRFTLEDVKAAGVAASAEDKPNLRDVYQAVRSAIRLLEKAEIDLAKDQNKAIGDSLASLIDSFKKK